MGALVSLDTLLADRRLWRGQPTARAAAAEPSGHAALDAVLPADGRGELRLVLPTLARHTGAGCDIALVAPPYVPNPLAWRAAGVDTARMHLVTADPRDALWATEQCLRAGCLSAVLCWPQRVDDRALRRLQVAAESGQALVFAFRDARVAAQPSPAALRLQLAAGQLRVIKCRGGLAPAQPVPFPLH